MNPIIFYGETAQLAHQSGVPVFIDGDTGERVAGGIRQSAKKPFAWTARAQTAWAERIAADMNLDIVPRPVLDARPYADSMPSPLQAARDFDAMPERWIR